MSLKLSHKTLAEAHHLGIRLASRAEVRTTFGTAHRQGGKGILEGLLEGKELHNAEVDTAVEPYSALVWADGAVHLHPESAVDLYLPAVVHPRDPENDDPFRFYHPFHNFLVKQGWGIFKYGCNAFEHLFYRLVEFRFSRIPRCEFLHELSDVILCES